jgi:hypothetical protein
MSCEKHDFSREVRGKYRTDGYGVCIHCGMSSSSALPPETVCYITGVPTKHKFKDQYICWTEYFKIPFDEILKDALESNSNEKYSFMKEDDINHLIFKEYNMFHLEKAIFMYLINDKQLTEREFDVRNNHYVIFHFEHLFEKIFLGYNPFGQKKFPEFSTYEKDLLEQIEHSNHY